MNIYTKYGLIVAIGINIICASAMIEEKDNKDQASYVIKLNIYPEQNFKILAWNRSRAKFIHATIENINKDQVEIMRENSLLTSTFSIYIHDKIEYNLESFTQAVKKGLVDRYPLFWHRKLYYKKPEQSLIICMYDRNYSG
jgi:lantibiotic modifying enzyme